MLRRWLVPFVLALLVMLVLCAVAQAAPSNPTDVTTKACSFSTSWFDGLSRWLFGLSLVLLLLAALLGFRNMHTEGPWAIVIGIAGVGIVLGLIALMPTLAPVALAAAGAPACP